MQLRLVCAILVFCSCPIFGQPNARDIILRAVAAERENRSQMVNYLFLEEIVRRSFGRNRELIADERMAHEVVFIEGRPAFRRTRTNGRRLTPEEDAAEIQRLRQLAADRKRNPEAPSHAEERRRAHPFAHFAEFHTFRLSGEEVIDGHNCWVIDSEPAGHRKPKDNDERRVAESSARFWIDRETLHRVRMDVTGQRKVGKNKLQEKTSYEWAPRDGTVWLVTRIRTLLPIEGRSNPVASIEGEQVYSQYRRFTTNSVVSAAEEIGESQQQNP